MTYQIPTCFQLADRWAAARLILTMSAGLAATSVAACDAATRAIAFDARAGDRSGAAQPVAGDHGRGSRAPAPHLVVGALPEQAVSRWRADGGRIPACDDQRIAAKGRRAEAAQLDLSSVTDVEPGKPDWRILEVGATDVQVSQLVERIFVEVGEQRWSASGEAAV